MCFHFEGIETSKIHKPGGYVNDLLKISIQTLYALRKWASGQVDGWTSGHTPLRPYVLTSLRLRGE